MPVYQLDKNLVFPPPDHAEPDGLLAVGGDLSPERLLLAYANGIFPWFDDDNPILWWSPEPRMILNPAEFHCSRSLSRSLKSGRCTVTMDTAFREVIEACAATPRQDQDGTWITREMIDAYTRLHDLGFAHSVECRENGDLVGGLYGISLGHAFFGESMFSHRTNSSKTAFAALCAHLHAWDFPLLDCQMSTPHLKRLGAVEVPRTDFLARLHAALQLPTRQGLWQVEPDVLQQLGMPL